MPKRLSKTKEPARPKRPRDVNQLAYQLVRQSTGEAERSPILNSDISRVMSAMGRKGGKIGGKKRLLTMTPERRSEVALKAAQARWAKKKQAH